MIKFSSKGHQITVQMICWFLFGAVLLMEGYVQAEENDMDDKQKFAHVISVKVTGPPQAYRFSVGIKSPDTGCEQYADWWEVLTAEGVLLYRRILTHSHVIEQPFTRSGGPVDVTANQQIVIRAHMHPDGYGGLAFQGSVAEGFEIFRSDPGFVWSLQWEPPLPGGCAF